MGERGHRILRARIADGVQRLDQAPSRLPGANVSQVFQITDLGNGNFPTDFLQYFAAYPTRVGGAEIDGQQGTLTPDSSAGPAYLLLLGIPGADPPPVLPQPGDFVIADECGGRWCFQFQGVSSSSSGCCDCIPNTLTLNSTLTGQQSVNIGLGGWYNNTQGPAQLKYGPAPYRSLGVPTPFSLAGNMFTYIQPPENGWWSDVRTQSVAGQTVPYRYWLTVDKCVATVFLIFASPALVYPTFQQALAGGGFFCTQLKQTVSVDAQATFLGAYKLTSFIPVDCDKFDMPVWSFGFESFQSATDQIDVSGNTDDGKDCVHLNDTNSGPGTTHDITELQGG